jgi:hypothetical protein
LSCESGGHVARIGPDAAGDEGSAASSRSEDRMTPIRADDPVTVAEAALAVGRAEAEFRNLARGALSPDGDRMPLRRALGVALLTQFSTTETLSVDNAVAVALTAAEGVADGGMDTMLVGWDRRGPFIRWICAEGSPASLSAGLHAPVVVIPAKQMLADLGEAVMAVRAGARQGMHQGMR